MALTAGTRLGHYDVTALLGEGGMGQVWQATDTQLNRQVALKILPDAFADDPDRLARFTREAQILASLNHPNIAAIHGIEEAEGTRALVLELVEGPTLADRIAKGPIPVDEALPIAKQIAEALEAAHEAGVIHRDLKPANIKVREDGTVKVLDFGLAKALDPNPEGDPSQSPTLTAAATQMGVIMGTAAYMSPEQAAGQVAGKRSDLWSFGVVLYEMLTGQGLFTGETVSHVLAKVLDRELDFVALPTSTPAPIRRLLRRCLERKPKRRLGDVGEALIHLEEATAAPADELSGGAAVAPVPQPTVWRQAQPWVAAVLLAAVAGAAGWSLRPDLDRHVTRLSITLSEDGTVSAGVRLALSPDGTQLVYRGSFAGGGRGQLYRRRLDQFEAQPIPGTEGAINPFFSPDGDSIGFFTDPGSPDGQLKRISVDGGPVLSLGTATIPTGSWGRDGTIVYTSATDGSDSALHRIPAGGGAAETLLSPDSDQDEARFVSPYILPNGNVVFSILTPGELENARVALLSVDTGSYRTIVDPGYNATYVPSGHLVYFRESTLMGVPFDAETGEVTGSSVPMLEGIRERYGISTSGTLAYIAAGEDESGDVLVWVDRDGREEPLPLPPGRHRSPRVSPDGTRVAVQVIGDSGADLWVYDVTTGTGLRLTREGRNLLPAWTPDGEHLVFSGTRNEDATRNVYRVPANGSNAPEQLTTAEERQSVTAVSSDGQVVVYTHLIDGDTWDVMGLPIDGAAAPQRLLTGPFRQGTATLSPNRDWLAYRSDESGQFEVYVASYPEPSARVPVSVGGGRWPLWAPDGQALFYESAGRLMMRVVSADPTLTLGSPDVVLDLSDYELGGDDSDRRFDISPDGARFLMPKRIQAGTQEVRIVQTWVQELTERVPTN